MEEECPRCGKVATRGHRQHLTACLAKGPVAGEKKRKIKSEPGEEEEEQDEKGEGEEGGAASSSKGRRPAGAVKEQLQALTEEELAKQVMSGNGGRGRVKTVCLTFTSTQVGVSFHVLLRTTTIRPHVCVMIIAYAYAYTALIRAPAHPPGGAAGGEGQSETVGAGPPGAGGLRRVVCGVCGARLTRRPIHSDAQR